MSKIKSDKYIEKYLDMLGADNIQPWNYSKEVAKIINKIYEDGFEDGANSK